MKRLADRVLDGGDRGFSLDRWNSARVIVLDSAFRSGGEEGKLLAEQLRKRGFKGKISGESAELFQALESMPADSYLVDCFTPHMLYASSLFTRRLRQRLARDVSIISVNSFYDGDGKESGYPKVVLVLRNRSPLSGHRIQFRQMGRDGAVLFQREVELEELQDADVWIPDRFFVEKERYLDGGMRCLPLGTLCRDIFRGAPGRFFSDTGEEAMRYLSLRHVGAGMLDVNSLSLVYVESVARLRRYLLHPGDVVVSCRGEFFRPMMLRGESSYPLVGGDNYIIIRPDFEKVEPGFLFRYLRSRAGQAFLFGMSTGKQIRVLNVRAMSEIPVPLPPKGLQREISENFTRAEERLESERRRVDEEYRETADSLFRKMGLLANGRDQIN